MARFTGLIGFFAILVIAYLMSSNKKAIKWRPVVWGLVLQIVIAICVLKGTLIAEAMAGIALPLERWGAALVFIGLTIVLVFLARRLPESARRGLWIAYGVASLYLLWDPLESTCRHASLSIL